MKTLGLIFSLILMTALVPTSSFAQPLPAGGGDPSRQKGEHACGVDARRLCRKMLDQGDMVVLDCLQTNQKKLSGSCRKFLHEQGQL